MKTRMELKTEAKQNLKGSWWKAMGFMVVLGLIAGVVVGIIGGVLGGLTMGLATIAVSGGVAGIVGFAQAKYFLGIGRKQGAKFEVIVDGFRQNWWRNALIGLLYTAYILVGIILFIIPGIYFAFKYSQVFFIANDEPNLSPSEVLKKSGQMMEGKKMELFVLGLSFIGWGLLLMLPWLISIFIALAFFFSAIGQMAGAFSLPAFTPSIFIGLGIGTMILFILSAIGAIALGVYTQTTVAGFYLDLLGDGKKVAKK